MAEETVVAPETQVDAAPAAAEVTPAATETPAATPETPQDDLFGALDSLLPKDDAPAAPEGTPEGTPEAQIPEQFQQMLGISDFVKTPEHVQSAIQAADEVWKVATGQLPARTMLEGFRQANPAQFQAISADIADYLQAQGLIQAPQNPLEGLKATHPQVYNAVAQFVQQQTGKALEAAPDPYHQRISDLEQTIAAEREEKEVAAYNAQVDAARSKASEWLGNTIKGTFAEGLTDRYIAPNGLLWQKAQQMQIPAEKVMGELLSGKTETVEKLWKAVEKDEAAIIRKFNANLVKQHNALKNGVPATKGAPVKKASSDSEFPPQNPGESTVDYGVRLMRLMK